MKRPWYTTCQAGRQRRRRLTTARARAAAAGLALAALAGGGLYASGAFASGPPPARGCGTWAERVNTDSGIINDPALSGTTYQLNALADGTTYLQKMAAGHCQQKVTVIEDQP
jgi:hypothetical protein